MRLLWLSALLPLALVGCGGSGGSSSPAPVSDSIVEDGTAQFKVDLASGKVKIQPIETGKSTSATMGGSTVTFTTSDVIVEGGELGRKSIKVSMRNNLKESIGGARPIRIHFGTTTPQLNYDTDVRDLVRTSTIWSAASAGSTDGPITTALSEAQAGCAVGADGAVYVATTDNRIRKVYNGYVSTVATNCRLAGIVYLKDPASGREYLVGASDADHVIRTINIQSGTVVTWAGAVGVAGFVNGAATTARFSQPVGIAVEPGYGSAGNLVVSDPLNSAVRGIAFTFSGGNLVAGNVTTRYSAVGSPYGIGVMADKTVVVSDLNGHRVRIFNLGGSRETSIGTGVAGDASGAGNVAQFSTPEGLAIVGTSIIVGDSINNKLKKIQVRNGAAPLLSANWQVSDFCFSGTSGTATGPGTTAQTINPSFLALAPDGSLALTNYSQNVVRIEADAPAFDLGSPQGSGSAGASLTNQTGYSLLDGNRRPYIEYDQVIAPGQTLDLGQWDFSVPDTLPAFTFSVTVDSSTSVFGPLDAVLSNGTTPGSEKVGVTELTAGVGFNISNLPNSRMSYSYAGAYDVNGNLFLALPTNRCVVRFDRLGNGSIVAGRPTSSDLPIDGAGDVAILNNPTGMVLDPNGRGLYIADDYANTIRYIGLKKDNGGQYLSPTEPQNWQVTTIAGKLVEAGFINGLGNAARLYRPFGICGTFGSTLYFTQANNNVVSQMIFDGGNPADATRYRVSTLAGSAAGTAGYTDGIGGSAKFSSPFGICETSDDNLIVADFTNYRLRRINKANGNVTTIAGTGAFGEADNADALLATLNPPYSVASDRSGAIYFNGGSRVRRWLNGGTKTVAGGGASVSGRTGATRQFNQGLTTFIPDVSGDLVVGGGTGTLFRLSRILGNR